MTPDPDAAYGHDLHERSGASTAWVEVCWKCAEEWLDYTAEHPDEHPPFAIVLAARDVSDV